MGLLELPIAITRDPFKHEREEPHSMPSKDQLDNKEQKETETEDRNWKVKEPV